MMTMFLLPVIEKYETCYIVCGAFALTDFLSEWKTFSNGAAKGNEAIEL
jgi:hypothetical protein